MSEWTIKFR